MLHNILLKAGKFTEIAKQGKFINVVLAAGEITARIRMDDDSVFETLLVSGMAFPVPQGFKSVALSSDITQQTKVWLGNLPLTYSPLTSKIVGSSALSSTSVALSYGSIIQIAKSDVTRKAVTLYSIADFFVGGIGLNSNNAIKILAGVPKEIGTQAELYGFTDNAAYFGLPAAVFDVNSVSIDSRNTALGNASETIALLESTQELFFEQSRILSVIDAQNLATGVISTVVNDANMSVGNFFDKKNGAYIYASANNIVSVDLATKAITSNVLTGWQALVTIADNIGMLQLAANADNCVCNDGNFNFFAGSISGGIAALIMPFAAYNMFMLKNGRLAIMQGTQIAVSTDNTYSAFGAIHVLPFAYDSTVSKSFDAQTSAIYFAKGSKIYKSSDYSVSFIQLKDFLTETITAILAHGDYITVSTNVGLHQSTDGGNTWTYSYSANVSKDNNALLASDSGDLFCAGTSGIIEKIGGTAKIIGGLNIAVMSEVN